MVVHRPEDKSFDQQLSAHTSIRCAWAPTCSPAHAITDSNAADPELLKTASKLASDLRERERDLRTHHPQAETVNRHPLPAPLRGSKERSLSIGFYVNWDDNSYPALKRALPHLDWVIPSWLSLEGPDLELKADVDDRVLKLIQETKPDVPVLPMIQNAVEGKWDGPASRDCSRTLRRGRRASTTSSPFLEANKFQGLTIDFEEVPPKSQKDLRDFLSELSSAFTAHGLAIVLAVPFDDDSWPYATYAQIADYLLLMGYDQHWDKSAPGSIAGEDWFEDTLDKRMQELDPDRTIVAIGGYGYDWVKGHETQELTFEEAVLSAKDSEADIEFDPRDRQSAFLLHRGRREPSRCVVSGRCNGVQRDRSRGRLSHGRLCALAYRLRRSLGLVCPRPALRYSAARRVARHRHEPRHRFRGRGRGVACARTARLWGANLRHRPRHRTDRRRDLQGGADPFRH